MKRMVLTLESSGKPSAVSLLQRKCACHSKPRLSGSCEACSTRQNYDRNPSELMGHPHSLLVGNKMAALTNPHNAVAGPTIDSRLGHNFSSVAILSDESTSMLSSPILQAVHSRFLVPHRSNNALAASAALYEENLEGQPSPDAGVVDDSTEAIPLETYGLEVPLSDSATGGTQTGATRCDTATGKVITATLNTNECTKDCSTKHEDKHAADIGPCCAKAGEASKAATTDTDKAAVQTNFDNWMISNKPFLECRAYAVSISCGESKHKKAGCEKASYGKCCKALVWYIRTSTLEGRAACNNAEKNLSDCPFS